MKNRRKTWVKLKKENQFEISYMYQNKDSSTGWDVVTQTRNRQYPNLESIREFLMKNHPDYSSVIFISCIQTLRTSGDE